MNENYKYETAVFDIDGTLLDKDENLFEGVLEGLTLLKLNGVSLFIATGRNAQSIKNLRISQNFFNLFNSNLVLNDGNVIYNYFKDEIQILNPIPSVTVKSIVHSYCANASFVIESNGLLYSNSKRALMKYKLIYRIPRNVIKILDIKELSELNKVTEIYLFYEANKISIEEILFQNDDLRGYNIRYLNGIKLYPANSCKAEALKKIIQPIGINLNSVIAFGDAENDITLVEKCGLGVAVPNCREALNTAANLKIKTSLGIYLRNWNNSLEHMRK
ncbi:HMP-PP phosphatase [Bacillus safensis]|uniref:HAD-IIB family hydrolase n=1 Tax=Bacillus safensis TaxID=561879 RepID=UPI0006A7FC6C|nr:HAD-IIB family hydrolase [Bacillus safensis]CUB23864.1 HMP-PP phosphatase [Bacillus safensis]